MKYAFAVLCSVSILSACGGTEEDLAALQSPYYTYTPTPYTPTPYTPTPYTPTPSPPATPNLAITGLYSAEDLSAMSRTSTMPSGSATYSGGFFAESNNYEVSYSQNTKYSADLDLSADFDAQTVSMSLDNVGLTSTVTNTYTGRSVVAIAETTGAATGSGTIIGNMIIIPTVTGTITPYSITMNGSPATLTDPGSFTVQNINSLYFVGDDADGIYASTYASVDGAPAQIEIAANKDVP